MFSSNLLVCQEKESIDIDRVGKGIERVAISQTKFFYFVDSVICFCLQNGTIKTLDLESNISFCLENLPFDDFATKIYTIESFFEGNHSRCPTRNKPSSKLFAVSTKGGLCAWCRECYSCVYHQECGYTEITGSAMSKPNMFFVSGKWGVKVYKIETYVLYLCAEVLTPKSEGISALTVTDDLKIFVGSKRGMIFCYQYNENEIVYLHQFVLEPVQFLNLEFQSKFNLVCACLDNGTVFAFSPDNYVISDSSKNVDDKPLTSNLFYISGENLCCLLAFETYIHHIQIKTVLPESPKEETHVLEQYESIPPPLEFIKDYTEFIPEDSTQVKENILHIEEKKTVKKKKFHFVLDLKLKSSVDNFEYVPEEKPQLSLQEVEEKKFKTFSFDITATATNSSNNI